MRLYQGEEEEEEEDEEEEEEQEQQQQQRETRGLNNNNNNGKSEGLIICELFAGILLSANCISLPSVCLSLSVFLSLMPAIKTKATIEQSKTKGGGERERERLANFIFQRSTHSCDIWLSAKSAR